MTSDTIVVRALYDAALYWDERAEDDSTAKARAEEYREHALKLERVAIGMGDE